MIYKYFLILVLSFFLLNSASYAQTESSVQLNLDVLDVPPETRRNSSRSEIFLIPPLSTELEEDGHLTKNWAHIERRELSAPGTLKSSREIKSAPPLRPPLPPRKPGKLPDMDMALAPEDYQMPAPALAPEPAPITSVKGQIDIALPPPGAPGTVEPPQTEEHSLREGDELYEVENPSAESILKSIDQKMAAIQKKNPPSKPAGSTSQKSDKIVSFIFAPGVEKLTDHAVNILAVKILPELSANPDLRIQIHGFATSADNGQTSARRISLARALSVRAYLMDSGVDPNRLDIRALGDETETTPIDRVDILFFPE